MTTPEPEPQEELNELEQAKQALISQGNDEEAIDAYIELGNDDLSNFAESYQGKFSSDEDFARDMTDQQGDWTNNDSWPHYCIDWEWAARELMMDYSEQNGYYFRNL